MYGAVAWCKTAPNQTSRLMARGANMNDNPKAASTQESIAFHFDFADAAEHERPLMEGLRRTQSALAKAKDDIRPYAHFPWKMCETTTFFHRKMWEYQPKLR